MLGGVPVSLIVRDWVVIHSTRKQEVHILCQWDSPSEGTLKLSFDGCTLENYTGYLLKGLFEIV